MNPVAIPPASARPPPASSRPTKTQVPGTRERRKTMAQQRDASMAVSGCVSSSHSWKYENHSLPKMPYMRPPPAHGSQHPLGDDAKRHGRQAQHCGHCAQTPSPLSSKSQAGLDDKARREVGPHAAKRRVRPAHEVEGRRCEHAGSRHAHKRAMKPHAPGMCGHMIHRPDSLRVSGFAIGRSDRPGRSDRLECDLRLRAWP